MYSCHEAHTLKDAATLMNERNISSLVVVDDDGALRGIITRSDLVRSATGSRTGRARSCATT
ncbi:MAG: CBS domain-containing protein [Caldilineaceae bacterium]